MTSFLKNCWHQCKAMTKENYYYSISAPMPMLVDGCKVSISMSLYASISNWIQEIPDQEMCAETVRIKPYSLKFVPNHL